MGEVSRCPKCGIEFVIEEVSEGECPDCGTAVPMEATSCPKCGASFDSEQAAEPPLEDLSSLEDLEKEKAADQRELQEEFSSLVEQVKALLSVAKEHGIDASSSRRLIDKAVTAGRKRDVESAVRTMRECMDSLNRSIQDRLERDIMQLENLAEVAKRSGSDIASVQDIIAEAKAKKDAGDLDGALSEACSGKRIAEKLTGQYLEAHEMYEALERAILNSERFYLDVREARKLLNESREAGERADWTSMGILARKGREELNRILPDMLKAELRKAKQSLLDAKASGRDVSAMVKILKDAGVAAKRERYEETLERLTEFRAEERA